MDITRILIIALLCSICSLQAEAQYKRKYKRHGSQLDIRYGVKLGFQTSNFTGDDNLIEFNIDNKHVYPPVTYKGYTSFHGGAYIDIRMSELFIIQPEIQYTGMGTKMLREVDLRNEEGNYIVTASSSPSDLAEIPIEKRLNYIQFPIMLKFGFTRLIHLNVGPVVSFKVSESHVYGDVPDTLVTRLNLVDLDAPDMYKSLDYGAMLGLSYQMENGLNFGIRYNRNFANINKNEGLDLLAIPPKNGTSSVMFNLGYTFQYNQRLRYSIGRRY